MKTIMLFTLIIILSACTHKSELKHESGSVVEKQYYHDTRQTVTGTGFTSGGQIVITSHSIGEDEKFIVIFKCSHGVVFSINRPDIYAKLEKGDNVTIDYYEVLNSDNEIKDLDFVDANAKTL